MMMANVVQITVNALQIAGVHHGSGGMERAAKGRLSRGGAWLWGLVG